jgi:phosphotransferase system enzyme I (PtsP)
VSRDNVRIELHINAGLLSHLPDMKALGADGIGLYRTEVPFIALGRYPTVHEQAQIYSRVMLDAGKNPIVFRTLDIGSDKKLSYLPHLPEDNPALGWRGIRIGLDRPALLRQQYRALLLAANGRKLKIMIPMVAAVGELQSARRTLDMECEYAVKHGVPLPSELQLGVMLEIPSLIWQMDELLAEADFISIGSNDLFQYTYAVDRAASHLQGVFDPLCRGFLKMLREIATDCAKANIPLSLCGEMGGKPIEAMALIGLGMRNLSMSGPAVPAIKTMVSSLSVAEISQFMHQILDISPPMDYRAALRAFALDHGIELGQLPQNLPQVVG